MNIDGSGQTNLTSAHDTLQLNYPYYSQDGSKIVMQGQINGGAWNIYLMNSDGTGLTQLTGDTVNESAPDWSWAVVVQSRLRVC